MSILIRQEEAIPESLDDIFADDDLDLLSNVQSIKPSLKTELTKVSACDRLISFVQTNNRLPDENNPNEFDISLDLQEVQSNYKDVYAECLKLLGQKAEDEQNKDQNCKGNNSVSEAVVGELSSTDKIYNDLDDIFNDDDLGILDYEKSEQNIFKVVNKKERCQTISQVVDGKIEYAEPCKDFYRYEKIFTDLVSLVRNQDIAYIPIKGNSWTVNVGDIFLVKNIHRIVIDEETKTFITGHKKEQRRVTLVYENKLIQKPFDSSLNREFSRDDSSKRMVAVTKKGKDFLNDLKDILIKFKTEKASDVLTGYVYVLRSLSTNSSIQNFVQNSHLVKIGYCTTSIEDRIKNCQKEPTYLEGAVEVAASYKCYNFDPHKLERLVHAFLGQHKLNVELTDLKGRKYKPKEWFTVSIRTACETVERILDGTIYKYRIDPIQGKLVEKR